MNKTILITGATGLIGSHLAEAIIKRGDMFIALSTEPESARKKLPGAKKIIRFDEINSLADENIDAVINLAGANLGAKRWNDRTKKEFYDSRINTTRCIAELISNMKNKPEVLVSASGVDYYGERGSESVYEDSPPAGDYLGILTRDWELEALKAEQFGVRVVTLRTGFVIARNSDAVKKMVLPYRFFAGGPIGSGRQYVSWIHIDDITGIYLFSVDNRSVSGAINATAPNPVTMKEFSRDIGKALHRPAFFPVPSFALRLIAGEMAVVILSGRKALPRKIMELGHRFRFPDAAGAWIDVLGDK